jgi:hypothetical protein
MSVYMIQCLCPQRHAIVGFAYEADEPSEEKLAQLQSTVAKMIGQNMIDPWCGICRSRDWHYEQAKTRFRTMAEAEEPMREAEAMQAKAREFFKRSKN